MSEYDIVRLTLLFSASAAVVGALGEDRWLYPACFGVPDDLHDLLPTVD